MMMRCPSRRHCQQREAAVLAGRADSTLQVREDYGIEIVANRRRRCRPRHVTPWGVQM